jgi:Zn-finger nucleic acid-binding protein
MGRASSSGEDHDMRSTTTTTTTTRSPSVAPLTICPTCLQPTLRPAEAEPLLPSRRCATCGGQFIRGEHYYRWLDHPDRSATTRSIAGVAGEVIDTPKAKICPECGKLMRRYRVGPGLAFAIDRCSTCAGIWFDANEWEALRRQGLDDRVHFVFSDAWRTRLLRNELDAIARRRVEANIGSADFAELQRVASWIERHPHRDELSAYLLTRLRGSSTAHA